MNKSEVNKYSASLDVILKAIENQAFDEKIDYKELKKSTELKGFWHRFIMSHTGKTINELCEYFRLEEAKKTLISGQRNVGQILMMDFHMRYWEEGNIL